MAPACPDMSRIAAATIATSVTAMAQRLGMAPSKMVARRDATPHQHMLHLRIERAKRLLEGDCASISDVGLSLGFSDQSHFTRIFRRLTGRTPTQFRRGGSQRRGGTA